jgi:hypothetical protein
VAEHEKVTAEEKIMTELLDLDSNAWDGLASPVTHGNAPSAFSVLGDAGTGLGEDVLVGGLVFSFLLAPGVITKHQGGCGGSGFEERPSIHRASKPQVDALLKKIYFLLVSRSTSQS